MKFRIGYGYDVHALGEGLPLILGGVEIEHAKGCIAHSDANVGRKVLHVVRLLLPNPKHFVERGLPIGAADGEDRELFFEVIAVHDAEFFDGMRGRAVFPSWTHMQILVGKAIRKDILAGFDKNLVCVAHAGPLSV